MKQDDLKDMLKELKERMLEQFTNNGSKEIQVKSKIIKRLEEILELAKNSGDQFLFVVFSNGEKITSSMLSTSDKKDAMEVSFLVERMNNDLKKDIASSYEHKDHSSYE